MARFLKKRDGIQGKPPGSLVFIGKKKEEKASFRYISYNEQTIQHFEDAHLETIPKFEAGQVHWLNLYGIHNTDIIKELGVRFAIPSLTLEDILNTDHRPGIVEFEHGIFVIAKSFYYNKIDNKIHTDQISFVLGKDYVITFQEKHAEIYEPVRTRLREKTGKIRQLGADYLLYALLDTLVDNTLITIEELGQKVEETESRIPQAPQELALELYNYKNEINYIRKSLRPYKDLSFRLYNSQKEFIQKKTIPYLQDLHELINQAIESSDIYYAMIQDQINLYNTYINNKANEIMKFLTIFASIFIPLTFLVGIYGTNFTYMPELHFKYSYFIMWGVLAAIGFGMLYYFKRKKWF